MTDEQLLEMIKDIVSEVDYDRYKEIFVYDDEDAQYTQHKLLAVAKRHITQL